jgi:TolB-like protein
MKRPLFFRLLSMLTVLFYSTALAQAGQVITQGERSWAKEAVQQKKTMGAISTPNSIAVLYFNNTSGKDTLNPLQKGMAVLLLTDLEKLEQLQVVSRVRMQALLDEMALGSSGVVDKKNAPVVAKLLGAYFVVSGAIVKGFDHDLTIESSVLDVPFEALTEQATVAGTIGQLFKLEKEILFNIIDQLQITLSPAKKLELSKPLSTSTTALLALFLGIDHSDKGQYAQAAKMYEQALIEDPHLTMARSGLQEVKAMGLTGVETLVIAGDEPLLPPSAEDESSSMTTYVGIGLAVAAIGGLALALSGSGSGGDDTSSPVDPSPGDTTSPTVSPAPDVHTTVACSEGSITFTFSESMDQGSGQIVITPDGFAGGNWGDEQHYVVSWDHFENNYCSGFESDLVITFNGLQDSAGNALTGRSSFSYNVAAE